MSMEKIYVNENCVLTIVTRANGENIARDLYERLGFKTHYRRMILKINDDIYEN